MSTLNQRVRMAIARYELGYGRAAYLKWKKAGFPMGWNWLDQSPAPVINPPCEPGGISPRTLRSPQTLNPSQHPPAATAYPNSPPPRRELSERVRIAKARYEMWGGRIPPAFRYSGHDVSDEPRDEKGRWTTGSGAGSQKEDDNSPDSEHWSLKKKQQLWKLADRRSKATGRLVSANDRLKAYKSRWLKWDPHGTELKRLEADVEKAKAEIDAIDSDYVKTLGYDPRDPLLVAGDEALQWSYGYKFYKSLEYACEHNLFDKEVRKQIDELRETLKDPAALSRFILIMGGMMVAKKALCKSSMGPIVGGLFTAKEAADVALTLSEIKSNLDSVTYASEVSNSAPKIVQVTTDLLKQIAFSELIKKIKCFAAGTQVVVADPSGPADSPRYRTVAIETLKPGDLVLARDEYGSTIGLQKIEETYQRVADHLRVLTFSDTKGTTQTIRTTDDHPFWIASQNHYVNAGELTHGSVVTGPQGEQQTLTETSREQHFLGVPVFNFSVAAFHTYFVCAAAENVPVVVHNADRQKYDRADETHSPQQTPKSAAAKNLQQSSGLKSGRSNVPNKVNGRMPIHASEYAGKTYFNELPKSLQKKYPNGVRFHSSGFPDFSPYSTKSVTIKYTGTRHGDCDAANVKAGFINPETGLPKTPTGFAWRHHHDVGTDGVGRMELVPSDLHSEVKHTGGVARWQELFPGQGSY